MFLLLLCLVQIRDIRGSKKSRRDGIGAALSQRDNIKRDEGSRSYRDRERAMKEKREKKSDANCMFVFRLSDVNRNVNSLCFLSNLYEVMNRSPLSSGVHTPHGADEHDCRREGKNLSLLFRFTFY